MKKELVRLYNGIMNDYSIQRYTSGWVDVINAIDERYKNIEQSDEQFENELLLNALAVTNGKLHKLIITFAKELSLNLSSLKEKENNKRGNHRSPFGTFS
jgi:hypothetical protein